LVGSGQTAGTGADHDNLVLARVGGRCGVPRSERRDRSESSGWGHDEQSVRYC
jgi:hypothetical protein